MRRKALPILWAAFGAAVASTVVELLLWWIVGAGTSKRLDGNGLMGVLKRVDKSF